MKFGRGYEEVNEKLSRKSRYTMSCYNCNYFYMSKDDDEEVCQNSRVLEYDMVISPTNIYCHYWEPCVDETPERPKEIKPIKSILKARRKK